MAPPKLCDRTCKPCQGGEEPLKGKALEPYRKQLSKAWQIQDEQHLERTFSFADFRQALDFTNQVGELAESEGHHPDICLGYGEVKIQLWTHKIGGLSEADFILAAKIDRIQAS
jgi:4a-hydroxytetrahydrobiopterin dehydratase